MPPYPPQQYAAAPHAYPPAHAAGMAVTGYPAAAPVHHVQPMAVGPAPEQGSPAFINQEPCGCCTVGWVLFGVSDMLFGFSVRPDCRQAPSRFIVCCFCPWH
jgi:hypothetical protein